MNPFNDAFCSEIPFRSLTRDKVEVRDMVGDDSIDLLRHTSVEGPHTGLDMGNRNVKLDRSDRGGGGRIGVAIHEDDGGPGLTYDDLERFDHSARHCAVREPANLQVAGRTRQTELPKEHVGHVVVVVLPGVDEGFLHSGPLQRRRDGRRLHELRTRSHYAQHIHGHPSATFMISAKRVFQDRFEAA